jgi:CRP/FNR family transcriptional regulator, cyclic AMP receptor protein
VIRRFRGETGRRVLVEALCAQKIVGNDRSLAARIAAQVVVRSFRTGEQLIQQGDPDNDLLLLLSGSVTVQVNGRDVATRASGEHVGEMALIDPGARRSATVLAREPTVAAVISEPAFTSIAVRHTNLWRALASELGRRLRQRGNLVVQPHAKPLLFIGSSSEAAPLARAIRGRLPTASLRVALWTKGLFGASRFPLEDLEAQLRLADFALLVATPDDRVSSRGRARNAPRDNVVFELGLFMGALSRSRTFLLAPRGLDLKIPTDLLGLTTLLYEPAARSRAADTTEARRQLLDVVRRLGPR